MHSVKSVTLIFCFISVLYISAQKKQLPVKIIEATYQTWVSGAPGGRTGIKYSIKVYISTHKKIEFQNFWLGKENLPFDVEFFSLDIPKKIQQGDTLLLTYNKINGERSENDRGKRLPINYKGAGLIELTADNKTRYFIVKMFRQLQSLRGQ